jgi:tRNA pseudouridine55 synthase
MDPAEEPCGVLLVDKDRGPTSHDIVDRVRRLYGTRRVGHAGTLDPMATGLLILLVGKATKASAQLMSQDKTYEADLTLGVTTDSQDADGEVRETRPVPPLEPEAIRAAMARMLGDQYQTPPMHSARKVGGVPLYKLAHKGQEIPREPRFIHVESMELLGWEPPVLRLRTRCSKGTYVRTLGHDLGQALGPGGHLTALRRTASGALRVEDARTLEALGKLSRAELLARLIPVAQAAPSQGPA